MLHELSNNYSIRLVTHQNISQIHYLDGIHLNTDSGTAQYVTNIKMIVNTLLDVKRDNTGTTMNRRQGKFHDTDRYIVRVTIFDIEHITISLLNLRFLIFSAAVKTENKLRDYIRHTLRIDHYIEFGNVHSFGKPGRNCSRPIVARFIYYNDLQFVLKNACRLKGSQFGINHQFPAEIVARWQKLYPKMREAKQQRREVVLVRDRLYIDGEQYFPTEDRFLESEDNIINPSPPHESGKDESSTRTNYVNNLATPGRKPANRSRVGSSPPQTNTPVA